MQEHMNQQADAKQSIDNEEYAVYRRPRHGEEKEESTSLFVDYDIFKGWHIDRKQLPLGMGGFSTVRCALHIGTHQKAAFKIMFDDPTGKVSWASQLRCLKRERDVLSDLKHQNVIQLLESDVLAEYEKQKCCVLVLEFAAGGCLWDFAAHTDAFDMKATRSYFRQMISGLEAIHKTGYAHRDLKLDNMLLDANYVLKIADFGLSAPFATESDFIEKDTRSGTPGYRAPEMLRGKETQKCKKPYCPIKCDIFALGVTLFKAFAGCEDPFYEAKESDKMWTMFCEGIASVRSTKDPEMGMQFWNAHNPEHKFSAELQNLLEHMMHPEPEHRYGIQHIKLHAWYCGMNQKYNAKELYEHMKSRRKEMEAGHRRRIREKMQRNQKQKQGNK